jgi:hypothetical protein
MRRIAACLPFTAAFAAAALDLAILAIHPHGAFPMRRGMPREGMT